MAEAGTTLVEAGVFAGRRADPVLGVVRVLGSLHGWTFILRTRLPWKDSCLCNPSPGFDVYDPEHKVWVLCKHRKNTALTLT